MNSQQNVFLTGASSGIGLETARLLASRGFRVWGTSRDIKRLPNFPNFHPVTMDLTGSKSIRENFATASKEAGYFHVLINNSGAGWFGPVEFQDGEIVRQQFELMVHGPLELIRLALPQMRERQNGLIINVTSLAARFPIPFLGPYGATKAALGSLTENLRHELADTSIRVVEVQPGDINTNFHAATRRVDGSSPGKTRLSAVWSTIDRNMASAPPPGLVAEAILKIIKSPKPRPVVVVGNFFQARLAPLLVRIAPRSLSEQVLRRYYRL